MKQHSLFFFLLSFLGLAQDGILQLNSTSFEEAIAEFSNVVIYFSSQQCSFCTQFDLPFTVVSEKWSQNKKSNIVFAKIKVEGSEQIFSSYQIEAVPDVRFFKKGRITKTRYNWLTYDQSSIQVFNKWVGIGMDGLKQIEQMEDTQCSLCKRFIFDCDSKFSDELLELSTSNLDMNFQCLSGLKEKIIYLQGKEKKKQLPCIEWEICQQDIQKLINSGIQSWNHQHVHKLFNQNKPAFILLVNNDQSSDKTYIQFTAIKNRWDQQNKLYPSFVIANLSSNIQQVSRLKSYIGGYEKYGYPYPFPLLAYLENVNGEVRKYLYETKYENSTQSDYTIEEWMIRVLEGKEERFVKGELSDKLKQDVDFDEAGRIFKLGYVDVVSRIKQSEKALIVLYYWKNSLLEQEFITKVKLWWGKNKINNKFQFHELNLFYYDAPPGVVFNFMPAFLIYNKERKVVKHEGIVKTDEMERILNDFIEENSL